MNTPKSIKPWDLSQGSKLPQKGDRVRVIPEVYKKMKEDSYNLIRKKLPETHPFAIEIKAPNELLRRAEAGEVATVTWAENSRSENGIADLKFEDGFECGTGFGMLSKVED